MCSLLLWKYVSSFIGEVKQLIDDIWLFHYSIDKIKCWSFKSGWPSSPNKMKEKRPEKLGCVNESVFLVQANS